MIRFILHMNNLINEIEHEVDMYNRRHILDKNNSKLKRIINIIF